MATIKKFNKSASQKDQLPIGLDIKIDKTAPQADAEVSKLKADGCEAVLLDAFGPLAAKIINYADSQKFRPKWLVHYFNNVAQFVALLNPDVRDGIISTTTFARSEAYNSPGWKDFAALMDKNGLPKTGMSAAGYYIAEAFTEVLKRTGKDLTREKMLKTIEGMAGWQCSICLVPWTVSKKSHWAFSEPVLATIKNGVWQKYE
jgi:ABC-type branched-subunit amino acid transport system substrate-binding protein